MALNEKDIEFEDLGPGKGARITLTGVTADKVNAVADRLGIDGSDLMRAAIEAFIKDSHLQEEVIERLKEETKGANGADTGQQQES